MPSHRGRLKYSGIAEMNHYNNPDTAAFWLMPQRRPIDQIDAYLTRMMNLFVATRRVVSLNFKHAELGYPAAAECGLN